MISISATSITLTPFSSAQLTQPFRAVGRKMRGTLTSFSSAASVNCTSVCSRSAAYLTEATVVFRCGSSSGSIHLCLWYQKFFESR